MNCIVSTFHLSQYFFISQFHLWSIGCSGEQHCLISMYSWIFQFSSCTNEVRKDIWYDFRFVNLLRLVLWPNIWSMLENVLYAFEKNVYIAVVGDSVLYIYIYVYIYTHTYIYYFHLVNSIVQIHCSHIDSLYGWSTQYWELGIKVPNCYFIALYFFL